MAKLIGTGKDPRFPAGQDYDVPEQDLQHHIDAKLGEPVEPGTEAYAVHRGYDTIAADPGEDAGVPAEQGQYGSASRVASRVETTSAPGKRVKSPEAAVKAAQEGAEQPEAAQEGEPEGEQGGSEGGEPSGARAAGKSGADKEGAQAQTGDAAEK